MLSLSAGLLWAQSPPLTGAPPFRYTDHLASLSVYSGDANVNLGITLAAVPGRGVPLTFALIYNSSFYANPAGAFVPTGDSNLGWLTGLNLGELKYTTSSTKQRVGSTWCTTTHFTNFRYYDPAGTEHPLSGSGEIISGAEVCGPRTISASGTATDGSGYSYGSLHTAPAW